MIFRKHGRRLVLGNLNTEEIDQRILQIQRARQFFADDIRKAARGNERGQIQRVYFRMGSSYLSYASIMRMSAMCMPPRWKK
jgi:hypothetical protein